MSSLPAFALLFALAAPPAPAAREPLERAAPAAAPATASHRLGGVWVEFLGWLPDSSAYAYRLVRLPPPGAAGHRSVEERLVRVPARGKPGRMAIPRGDLKAFCRRQSCLYRPSPRQRDEDGSVAFPQPGGPLLRFTPLVADVLRYRLTLDVAGRTFALGDGRFDDIYLATDAHLFVAPDGRAAAFVLLGQDLVHVGSEVHFVRLPPAAGPWLTTAPPVGLGGGADAGLPGAPAATELAPPAAMAAAPAAADAGAATPAAWFAEPVRPARRAPPAELGALPAFAAPRAPDLPLPGATSLPPLRSVVEWRVLPPDTLP